MFSTFGASPLIPFISPRIIRGADCLNPFPDSTHPHSHTLTITAMTIPQDIGSSTHISSMTFQDGLPRETSQPTSIPLAPPLPCPQISQPTLPTRIIRQIPLAPPFKISIQSFYTPTKILTTAQALIAPIANTIQKARHPLNPPSPSVTRPQS